MKTFKAYLNEGGSSTGATDMELKNLLRELVQVWDKDIQNRLGSLDFFCTISSIDYFSQNIIFYC